MSTVAIFPWFSLVAVRTFEVVRVVEAYDHKSIKQIIWSGRPLFVLH